MSCILFSRSIAQVVSCKYACNQTRLVFLFSLSFASKKLYTIRQTIARGFLEVVQPLRARFLQWRGVLWCSLECRRNPSLGAVIAELHTVLLGALRNKKHFLHYYHKLKNEYGISDQSSKRSTVRGIRNSESTSSESTKHIHQHVQTHIVLCSCIKVVALEYLIAPKGEI